MYKTSNRKTYRLYFYNSPNQKLDRYEISHLKEMFHLFGQNKTFQYMNNTAGPWLSKSHYSYDTQRYKYYTVPNCIYLRYSDGSIVTDVNTKYKYKKKKHKNIQYKSNVKKLGRFLRAQNVFQDEISPRKKRKQLYYEDSYSVRKTVKSWKHYRKTQYKT